MTLELLNQYVMPINRKMKKKLKVPKVPPRVLIDFATKCNLRCPMCVVWGSEEERKIDEVKGVMNLENARKFLMKFQNIPSNHLFNQIWENHS